MSKKTLGVIILALLLILAFFVYFDDIVRMLGLLRSPQPDFEISVNPESLTLYNREGSQNGTVITVKSIEGLSDNITFRAVFHGFIGDVIFTFDPPYLELQAGGQAQCILSLRVNSIASPGLYVIDIIATGSTREHLERITLTIKE